MERRLIEPQERWLLVWPAWALGLALLWRIAAGLTLWRGPATLAHQLGLIDSHVLAIVALACLLGLVRCLVPRDYAAASGLVIGGTAYLVALSILPRAGLLLHWPLGRLAPGWYIAGGLLLAGALLVQAATGLRWRAQLRSHGAAWTRRWAWSRPYAARRLAARALRYMGEPEA